MRVGSRSLDILIELIRCRGQLVDKRDLMKQVWGGVVVGEGALRVHIASLRKALRDGENGARYILNTPGRGYSFVGVIISLAKPFAQKPVPDRQAARLPPPAGKTVGRADFVAELVPKILEWRLVSLVGTGGIGKTTVALDAAHQLFPRFDGRIYFISLSVVADPQLALSTIASMIGLGAGVGDPLTDLLDFLGREKSLLLLDSCEHLLEPVAFLAEALMREASLVHIFTTTREPLKVSGEHVIRLPSLEVPGETAILNSRNILAYSSAQLFLERVTAAVPDFRLTDEHAAAVGRICRRLDGVALALELCAARVEAFGIIGTAELLDRRIGLVWQGRRTAPARQQTLHATLEWSHDLLDDVEKTIFARLAVFAGEFTLDAAEAVVSSERIEPALVVDVIASLVSKSLLSTRGRRSLRYRLLDTTRTYALTKLTEAGDERLIHRQHARFLARSLIDRADPGQVDRVPFLDELNDVRAALEWCFSDDGDASVGVELAASAATPLMENSLCDECQHWTRVAITALSDSQVGTTVELGLQASFGWASMFTGNGEAVQSAFERGLALADSDPDPDPHQQLSLINGLNFIASRRCDFTGALLLAERAETVARKTRDTSTIVLAEWALGVCHHLCGNQAKVSRYCDTAISPPPRSPYVRKLAEYGYDYRGRALIARARALWLRGFPEEAIAAAHLAIREVEELEHPISLLVVLMYAATVFTWASDWLAAEEAIERLLSLSRAGGLVYQNIGAALKAILNCYQGDGRNDPDELGRSLERLVEDRHLILVPLCRTTLAEALLNHGRLAQAQNVIDVAVTEFSPNFATVDGPEILRVKGEVLAANGQMAAGEHCVSSALNLARTQSALSFELRATMSQVCFDRDTLSATFNRFTEGFATRDLRNARKLLDG